MSTDLAHLEADLLFRYIPGHGRLAVDVGANEGVWSRELATRFEQVHAYEPQPRLTRAPENVEVRNVALGDHSGTALLRLYGNTEHATMVDRPDIGYGKQRGILNATLATLDELYVSGGVDFVKVDVEGAEVDVLRGARRLLQTDHPELLIEIHSPAAKRQVLELLDGYEWTIIPNPASDHYCWIHAA